MTREPFSGWWQYDEKTNKEIESAFDAGENSLELLIMDSMYTIDLLNNVQYRKNDSTRKRNIKREQLKILEKVKGVAGLSTKLLRNEPIPTRPLSNEPKKKPRKRRRVQ